MKIAIVGSGISGLTCAYKLHGENDVHVLEADNRIGGHTATVDVALGGRKFALDTGFIVYNDWTYPNFIALMEELGVSTKPTDMGFSFSDRLTGLEYAGSSLSSLFAQPRNLISPRFWGMLWDIVRFNRQSVRDLEGGALQAAVTLGEYLARNRYGDAFRDQYLIPMGSAIWSADTDTMLDFPLRFFVQFFHNHGLLNIVNRPQWRVIEGGSREYLRPLTEKFSEKIRTSVGIHSISRDTRGANIQFSTGESERFDAVIFACHSDQALRLLSDPTPQETAVLGAIPYQLNDVVLHTDTRLLPKVKKAWSAWNYQRTQPNQRATLTYNMNILQGLTAPETFCVTLNDRDRINPHKILGNFSYSHPVFSLKAIEAQNRWEEINGGSTWYCGAYWRSGFHEDGVFSALRVVSALDGGASDACEHRDTIGSAV